MGKVRLTVSPHVEENPAALERDIQFLGSLHDNLGQFFIHPGQRKYLLCYSTYWDGHVTSNYIYSWGGNGECPDKAGSDFCAATTPCETFSLYRWASSAQFLKLCSTYMELGHPCGDLKTTLYV